MLRVHVCPGYFGACLFDVLLKIEAQAYENLLNAMRPMFKGCMPVPFGIAGTARGSGLAAIEPKYSTGINASRGIVITLAPKNSSEELVSMDGARLRLKIHALSLSSTNELPTQPLLCRKLTSVSPSVSSTSASNGRSTLNKVESSLMTWFVINESTSRWSKDAPPHTWSLGMWASFFKRLQISS